jgi:hypothetical protein
MSSELRVRSLRTGEAKMEVVQEKSQITSPESRVTGTGFEPEVLAFCCEH